MSTERTLLAERHPYLFSGLLLLMLIAILFAAGAAATIAHLPQQTFFLAAFATLAVLVAIILTAMRWWRHVGFCAPADPRDLWLFWLSLVPPVVNLLFGVRARGLVAIAIWLILALLVGFVEEGIFRGLMLRAIAPRGPWRAALITAILFGVSHILNVAGGSSPAYVALQICYALAIGLAYAALALRTRMIWPLILAHVLTDFAGFVAADRTGGTGADTLTMVISAAYVVAFAAYGVWLLRGFRARAAVQP